MTSPEVMRREREGFTRLRSFGIAERGAIAVKFALMLPLLFGVVGGTIDYGSMIAQKARLQDATDAAAKAAALETTLVDTSRQDISAISQASIEAMMRADQPSGRGRIQVSSRAETNPARVTVEAVQNFKGPFGVLGGEASRLAVRSVAQVVGKPNICVLALDQSTDGAIELWSNAQMTGQNCAVYSNSLSSAGIKSKNNARMTASLICSVGGKDGGKSSFLPEPLTDCPTFDDPLAGRTEPPVSGCKATAFKVVSEAVTLQPGVYCGGLTISGAANVTFAPGVYVIKDGAFEVVDTASIIGTDVGFYLTGNGARIQFDGNTTISLSAPQSGIMAGLLFFESRGQPTSNVHAIRSDNARQLIGTIYLPRGELVIDANKPIADQSAYTAIVVRQMKLYSGPHLVLNTNYSATPVPVPEGIKGVGQPVALVQ